MSKLKDYAAVIDVMLSQIQIFFSTVQIKPLLINCGEKLFYPCFILYIKAA